MFTLLMGSVTVMVNSELSWNWRCRFEV